MSHADVLKKAYDVLQRCTTINFYVIDYLRAEDVLNEEQEHDLKTERNPLRQRILLYQWLKKVSHDKYESFLQVMTDTEQGHVANLLKGGTEENHMPLSDARYSRLVKIRHKMARVTRIDNELIAELRSQEAISMTDAEEIRAEKVESTRVSKLISVIMRRSNHSYDCFQEVLRRTFQKPAANFLSEGEMPAVHLNNKRPDLDESLSIAFNDVIRNGTENDPEINGLIAELHELGLDPANARPGQSIVIFIYCKTVDSAAKFTQLFNFGRLQNILERILNRLLLTIEPHNTETLNSIVNMEDEDVIALEEFTGIEGWMVEGLHRSKPFGKRYSNVATTQTERWNRRRQNTEPNKYRPKSGSSAFAGKAVGRTPQDKQENPTSGSGVRSGAKARWGKLASGSIIVQSSAESLSERKSLSSDRSSPTSQIADDDSGVYGWTLVKGRHSEKKAEEIKPSIRDKGLSGRAYKSKKGRLPDMPVELPVKFRYDPILVQTIRTKAGEEQYKAIRGLTILDNELFVVTAGSPEVEVYDSRKFSFSRRWNLRELINPQDIGSCSRNKCLYIIDSKFVGQSNEILRVDPNGMLILIWLTGDNCEWGLSVTDESNVISAVYDKHKLREYFPDGQLIREINLSTEAGIISPWHAIKLTNGHFAVSHGSGNNEQHKVSIVDANGKLQKSFGGTQGSTIVQMNRPVYLSIDGNGFVMVADHLNGRVLLLDPDLKYRREFLSKEKQGLGFPQRILLDVSNSQLFVADLGGRGGQILAFRLSH